MQEPFIIKKIAVLGAGVMGAQIAAHCVNAGIETLLFDLAAKEGNHNAIVEKAIINLGKLNPTDFYRIIWIFIKSQRFLCNT